MIIKRIAAGLVGLGLIVSMSACSADGVSDPAFTTLRYEGGDTGGSKFKEAVEPGEKLATNDRFYSYPNTQRQAKWDSDNFDGGAKSADYADMSLTAKGGVVVNAKVTVPFSLNTSTEPKEIDGKKYEGGTLQAFHEIFGKTRKGYFDTSEDGNGSYGPGWLWLMDTYLSNCVRQTLIPQVRAEDPEALWLNDSIRTDINSTLKEEIQACVDNAMETDESFYIVGNPTIDEFMPESSFVSLYRERQDAETKAETADLNKTAKVKEAEANAAVAQAEAEIKKAEISGYGGFDNYARLEAIKGGLNPYQPTYIVPGTKP